MSGGSLRVRLVVWNGLVLALSLTAVGVVWVFENQRRALAQIDAELANRARAAGGVPLPPEPGRFTPFRQPPMGVPGPPDGGPMRGRGMGPGPGPRGPIDDPFLGFRQAQFIRGGQVLRPAGQSPFDAAAAARAEQGHVSFTTIRHEGERVRVASTPWRPPFGPAGAVQVARDLRSLDEQWSSQMGALAIVVPTALLLALLGGAWMTGRALTPVRKVVRAAAQIQAEDLSRRLPVIGADELAELSATLNGLIGRVEEAFANQKRAYSDLEAAYANQRRFTADASHELRTPLTRLQMASSGGLAGTTDVRRALQVAHEAGRDLAHLVDELLTLSRADAGQLGLAAEPLDLRVVAAEAAGALPNPDDPRLVVELPSEPVPARGDPALLRRALLNLLTNALRHTPAGVVTLRAHSPATLVVADTGEGIAPEHLPHLTQRFYRVDKARARDDGGCGLGLAIVQSIAQAHGGRFVLQSELGKGTVATIHLPATRE